MIITNSEIEKWKHCRRCWYVEYYRKLRRKQDLKSPVTVGTLVHRGLRAYYAKKLDPLSYVKTKSVSMIEQCPDFADQIAEDAELAGIMLEGYIQWLADTGADADLEVYAPEQTVEVPLEHTDFVLRGKLDARAYLRSSGARVFLEHKTVGNLKDLPRTAQTNPQFLTYALLEHEDIRLNGREGERADGVLLNMLRRVKRTVRAQPPFYARHEVHYSVEELRNHWRHTVAWARQIQDARNRLDAGESIHYTVPPTSTRECFWRCGCSDVCMSGMFDSGADVEGYLAEFYEPYDPLSRYDEDEDDE